MRKIFTLLTMLCLSVGASWAQPENHVCGVQNIPTTPLDFSTENLSTGYYLIKQTNTADYTGFLKAAHEHVGAVVTPISDGLVAGNKDAATYIWYVEVGAESKFSIAAANKVVAWQEPSRGQKNLVKYASRCTALELETTFSGLSSTTQTLVKKGNYYVHASDHKLGSWDDQNTASLFYLEFYPVPEADLLYCSMPELSTPGEEPVYYNIQNMRTLKYANFVKAGQDFAMESSVKIGSYWYFVADEEEQKSVPEGVTACRIYNALHPTGVVNEDTGAMAAEDASGTVYYIKKHSNTHHGYVIYPKDSSNGWNSDDSNNIVCSWAYDNDGSIWDLVKTTKTTAQIQAEVVAECNAMKGWTSYVDKYKKADYYTYSHAVLDAAKEGLDAVTVPSENIYDIYAAHMQLTDVTKTLKAATKSPAPAVGDYLKFENRTRGGFLTVDANNNVVGTSNQNHENALWVVEEGGKLKNVNTGKYMGAIVEDEQVKVGDEALTFNFANKEECFAVFKETTKSSGNIFGHMSNGSKVIGWSNTDAASHWMVSQYYELTLVYKYNDEVLHEATTFARKGAYTVNLFETKKYLAIESCVVNETPLETVDGQFVATINGATTITVTLKEDLPFKVSKSYATATWYYLQVNSAGWEYVHNDGEAPYTNLKNNSSLGLGSKWAFVGDAINGFKILNKAATETQTLGFDATTDGSEAKMKEGETLWTIEKGNGGFVIRQGETECLNDYGDNLKFWVADGSPNGTGSAFKVRDASIDNLSELSNATIYALHAERSPLIYSATEGMTTKLSSGLVDGISHDVNDVNQQFLIVRTKDTPADHYYLYSVGAQKFVAADLSFADFPEPVLTFEASNHAEYPWRVKIADKYVIPGNGGTEGNKLFHITGGDDDDGKRYKIIPAGPLHDYSKLAIVEQVEGMITDASQLSNDKVYTVATYDRGYWYYLEGKDAMWSTVKAEVEANYSDPAQQFAFLTVAGKTYLYSVGAKKFVVKSGDYTAYSDDPTQTVELLKGQGNKFYPLVVAFVDGAERHQISISNGYEIPVLTNWPELAGVGNTVDIRETKASAELVTELAEVATKIENYLVIETLKPQLAALIEKANGLTFLDTEDKGELTEPVANAQAVLDKSAPTAAELNVQINQLTAAINSVVIVSETDGFKNNYAYTFTSKIGAMGAKDDSDNVISTARITVDDASAANNNFRWVVYKSESGRYYLYNVGKNKFMGVQSTGNASVPFVDMPTGLTMTFKKTIVADYPIMFSTDNSGSVNHSKNHGEGLITWSNGWDDTDDNGNVHKIEAVGGVDAEMLSVIAAAVEKTETMDAIQAVCDQVEDKLNKLGDAFGYYTTSDANAAETLDGLIASKNEVTIATELSTIKTLEDDVTALHNTFSLNVPEAGKFYRFSHNYGGEVGELYVQAKASNASGKANGMLMSKDQDAASIFYYADDKLLSYSQGLYVKESGNTRGLQSVGAAAGDAKFEAGTVGGKLGIFAGDSFHANESNGIRFIDHCGTIHNSAHDFTVEEVTTLPVNVSSVGVATLYTPVALEIPTDVNVYTAVQDEDENGAYLKLQLVETGYIPANTGVILEAEADTYDFKVTDEEVTEFGAEENVLTGKCETSNMRTDVKVYTLQKPTGRDLGFYLFNGTKAITGFRSWLELPLDAPALSFRFKFGTTTDIESLVTLQNAKAIYDLSGRRVENMDKGIYIVNGKKIVVK